MRPNNVDPLLKRAKDRLERTLVVVDHSNVRHWKSETGSLISLGDLEAMASAFAPPGDLRRLYCGADYGSNRGEVLLKRSRDLNRAAERAGFTVVSKRVKYLRSAAGYGASVRKCDLDVEIAVDLLRLDAEYDRVIVFSGDGDLVAALAAVSRQGKETVMVSDPAHRGREAWTALRTGTLSAVVDVGHLLAATRKR